MMPGRATPEGNAATLWSSPQLPAFASPMLAAFKSPLMAMFLSPTLLLANVFPSDSTRFASFVSGLK